jgi:hypothetical protein
MNHYFIPIKPIYDHEIALNSAISSHGYKVFETNRRGISSVISNSTFCDYTSGIASNIGCNKHGVLFMHHGSWDNIRQCVDLLGLMTYTFMDDSTIKIKYLCRNSAHSRTSHSIHSKLTVGKEILQYFLMCVKELSHVLDRPFMIYLNATEPSFYLKCGMINVSDSPHSNKIKELEKDANGFEEADLANYFVWDTEMPNTRTAKGYKKRRKTQKYIKCKTCKKRRKTKSRF